MKIGAENKKKTIFAGSFMVVAVAFLIWEMMSFNPTPSAPASSSSTKAAATATTEGRRNPSVAPSHRPGEKQLPIYPIGASLDPRLRLDLLKQSEGIEYAGNGVNIFQVHEEPVEGDIPKPIAPGIPDNAKNEQPLPTGPPPPLPPPPINLRFYGWASRPGEPLAVFLSQGEQVFLAREGQIIASRYKVVKITRTQVDVEDVLSNNKKSINLTEG